MASTQLSEMMLDELEHAQQIINAERDTLKLQALEIQRELDRRAVAQRARATLDAMSETEKSAVHQLLSLHGVTSAEQVGIPGE